MGKQHILLVDDEEGTVLSLSILLRKAGFKVTSASCGHEAYARAVESNAMGSPFDLLLCDITMPGWSGLDLMAHLREAGMEIPVIIMTGYNDANLLATLRANGCSRCIGKPFTKDEMIESIQSVLQTAASNKTFQEVPV